MQPAAPSQSWYLLKHADASAFGPISFAQLAEWARAAQISPLDKISADQTHWMRAPMLPELGMDWLVEVSAEHCYGPTTLGAVQDFLDRGEIGLETVLINARDGTSRPLGALPEFRLADEPADDGAGGADAQGSPANLAGNDGAAPTGDFAKGAAGPSALENRQSLHGRIRELEQSLLEERRLLEEMNERYLQLEAKYIRLIGHQSSTLRFDD